MTRGKALCLAGLTAWPFAVPVIGWLFEATGMISIDADKPPVAFVLFLGMLYLTAIEVPALILFYLGYLLTRPRLPLEWKLVWATLLVIGNVFSMPFFWYYFIWKPREFAPMQASSRFSLLVFSPLLLMLLLPLTIMFPLTLMTLGASGSSPASDPTTNTAIDLAWVVGPILAATAIFIVGRLFYSWFMRSGSPGLAWLLLWSVFTVLSIPVVWYATLVLRGMLPTDAPPNTLSDLSRIGFILAGMAQPLVLAWLLLVSRILRRFVPEY